MTTHESGAHEEVPVSEEEAADAEPLDSGDRLTGGDAAASAEQGGDAAAGADAAPAGEAGTGSDTGPEGTAAGELERLAAERDEYLAHLQRTQAEFDNYRKRMLREQAAQVERAHASLIEQLLPVLDSFELALGSAGSSDDPGVERLRKGVELVYAEFLGALEKAGLERIEALGKPFDPEEHEAVMHIEDDGGEPGVREIVRTGYRFKGRVLRPAMVKVAT